VHQPTVVGLDSVAAPVPRSRFDQPRWVMARSLLIPGWGQLYNHSWIKAIGVAAGEGWMVARLIDDRRTLDRLNQQAAAARAAGDQELEAVYVDAYNSRLNRFTSNQWVLGGVVAFALLDAYIDAHFRGFGVEFEGDPALPKGQPAGGKLRLSMRRAF